VIEIEGKILSRDLFEKKFVCDLSACKGACCVEGSSGAPLTEEEIHILEDIYEDVKPFLPKKGVKALEKQGAWVIDADGDYTTPLVAEEKECAYTIFENGMALCGIEKAHKEGKVKFKKPISCHLYPIRTRQYQTFEALNYDVWHLCKPACACGEKLQVPVYKFLKEALIRKYGEEFYKMVEAAAEEIEKNFKSK
jgi:hypothetical protein